MRRDPAALARDPVDLVVVGGGVHGAWVARDAALRGLSVALVERDDFGAGTSGNSLGIVHGGLRYLQTGDLRRARESVRERRAWLRVAPGLVAPLPVLVPTYRGRLPGRALLAGALALNALLSADRNAGLPPERRLGAGRVLSRGEALGIAPWLSTAGLTGGVLFHDARMLDPDRLTLAVVLGAAEAGARVANHAEATRLLVRDGRVIGVRVDDRLSGEPFDVRARLVVNAAGPDAAAVWGAAAAPAPAPPLARAMNVVLDRPLTRGAAVALASARGRFHFLAPWGTVSAVGTGYWPDGAGPDAALVRAFLAEVGPAIGGRPIGEGEVRRVLFGRLPCEPGGSLRLSERPRLIDHAAAGGPQGLLSVVGIKYTTARRVAERAVDLAFRRLGRRPPSCRTALDPLPERPVPGVREAVEREMALTLGDVLRRTGLALAGPPDDATLAACAAEAARALGWDAARTAREIAAVRPRSDGQGSSRTASSVSTRGAPAASPPGGA